VTSVETEAAPPGAEETSGTPPRRPVLRGWLTARLEWLLPLLGYAALVVTGTTTSSLNLLRTAVDPDPPRQLFESLPIRSDEWLTAMPIELGVMAHGASQHPLLSQEPDLIYQVSSGSVVESVLFLEGNLLRLGPWLPDAMLFAAFRGFSWVLLFLAMPALLRRLGATGPMAWLGTVLCFLAPASLWWSFMPIRILGFAAAGCMLLFLSRDRLVTGRRVSGLLLAGLAGLCLARLVTYYVPWSVTVGVPLVLATGLFLLRERDGRRVALAAIATGAGVGLLLLLGTFWENWSALHAELNTLYPGQRRATGMAQAPYQLFGAPGLSELEDDPTPTLLNQSEISSAFLICGVWAALLWSHAWPRMDPRQRIAVAALGIGTVAGASWAMLSWGVLGEHVPLLNVMLPVRAAQTVGYPATLAAVLVLSHVEVRSRSRALLAGAVCAAITAYGVSDLQRILPSLRTYEVWLTTLVVGLLVALVTWMPRRWLPTGVVAAALLVAGIDANPLVSGLGDMRGSVAAEKAQAMAADAERNGTLYAADTLAASALLVASGVPALTGYQVTGPDAEQWERLDPDRKAEGVWNRGASYLYVTFSQLDGKPAGAEPAITTTAGDVIVVIVDPCWLAESDLGVSHVVSVAELDGPCVEETDTFTWYNGPQHVYALRAR
jgi:hypothetical protein